METPNAASDNSTARQTGSVVGGRYRIEALLGTGGTSAVFRATHLGTDRGVAVKLLNLSLLRDEVAVKRFVREARTACRVVHPNVVEVLDAGLDESGRPYLVTELLEGETLADLLARRPGPLPLREVAALLLPLLDGLAVAHEKGVVHRDLKPANVLLHRGRDGRTVPKLLDFGVSKIVGRPAGVTLLTIPGVVFGTPHYISPEQALSSVNVDPRADVWSAGVLLYRLTVGRVPFDAPHIGALLSQVFDAVPTPPAALGVPASVSAVVLRCLSKDRAGRYADARALKAALCEALGVPVTAGGPVGAEVPSLRVAPPPVAAATVRPPRPAGPTSVAPPELSLAQRIATPPRRPAPVPTPPSRPLTLREVLAPPRRDAPGSSPPPPARARWTAALVTAAALACVGLGAVAGTALSRAGVLGHGTGGTGESADVGGHFRGVSVPTP